MVSDDQTPNVKENETENAMEPSVVNEENKDNKVKLIIFKGIGIKSFLFIRQKTTMKMKKIKGKKDQMLVMDGLDLIIHGHKHLKRSM